MVSDDTAGRIDLLACAGRRKTDDSRCSPGARGAARTPSILQNPEGSFGYPRVSSEGFKMFPRDILVDRAFFTLFLKTVD